MPVEFVADYVQECLSKGVQLPADIRKCAEDEISKINESIQKIEELRGRQSNLRAVIRQLGGGAKVKKTSAETMDFSMSWEDLIEPFQALCTSICTHLSSQNKDQFPRDIMNLVSDIRDQKAVYSAIKWLEHNEVIDRKNTDDGRAIVKGKRWDAFVVDIMTPAL